MNSAWEQSIQNVHPDRRAYVLSVFERILPESEVEVKHAMQIAYSVKQTAIDDALERTQARLAKGGMKTLDGSRMRTKYEMFIEFLRPLLEPKLRRQLFETPDQVLATPTDSPIPVAKLNEPKPPINQKQVQAILNPQVHISKTARPHINSPRRPKERGWHPGLTGHVAFYWKQEHKKSWIGQCPSCEKIIGSLKGFSDLCQELRMHLKTHGVFVDPARPPKKKKPRRPVVPTGPVHLTQKEFTKRLREEIKADDRRRKKSNGTPFVESSAIPKDVPSTFDTTKNSADSEDDVTRFLRNPYANE